VVGGSSHPNLLNISCLGVFLRQMRPQVHLRTIGQTCILILSARHAKASLIVSLE
jgi:hypothetical protein